MIELTDRSDVFGTYDVYKHCMYMPTEEKFKKKMDTLLSDDSVKIFACLHQGAIKCVMVATFLGQHRIEIIGIAVDGSARKQGIGSYMIENIKNACNLKTIYAETDDDAVGFYRKNGFSITAFSEMHGDETFIRYKCELTNHQTPI